MIESSIFPMISKSFSSAMAWFNHFESVLLFGGYLLGFFLITHLVFKLLMPILSMSGSDKAKKPKSGKAKSSK